MKQGINSRRTGNLLSRAGNLLRLTGNCPPCAGISPDLLFRSTTLCDFYHARKYYDPAWRNVARSYDAFSRFINLRLAEAAKAIDVRLRHRGKHLVPPGAEHRMRRLRHGRPSTISHCPLVGHSNVAHSLRFALQFPCYHECRG